MEKNQKDSKPESKTANHSKVETAKGIHTSRTTDQKMDEKKDWELARIRNEYAAKLISKHAPTLCYGLFRNPLLSGCQ